MTTPQPTTPAQLLSAAVVYGSNLPEPLPIQSADSLVEKVADSIYRNGTGDGFRDEARAAIREIAAWLSSKPNPFPHEPDGWQSAADVLLGEANR